MGPFHRCGLFLWRMVPSAILWSIWMERYNRIFRASLEAVLSIVTLRTAKRILARKEFPTLKYDDILYNWDTCIMSKLRR